MVWPFVSRRERLRRQASAWIARLNGSSGAEDRLEFERWYHASPDHAEAYERLAALFHAAGRARRPDPVLSPSLQPARRERSRPFRFAVASGVALAALLGILLLAARSVTPVPGHHSQFGTLASADGETRRIVLADGSEVLLSPGTRLEVALDAGERRLRLVRGEGRFAVAHEDRPFVVSANGTDVVARGTRFVVSLSSDRTTVSLIEGRVDVSHSEGGTGSRRVTRLQPGQQLVVEAPAAPRASPRGAAAPAEPGTRVPQQAMLQFDDTPLREAVEQVNARGRPPVRIGSGDIGSLRVTGAFRAGDTAGFAQSVAAALGLELERRGGSLWLRRAEAGRTP